MLERKERKPQQQRINVCQLQSTSTDQKLARESARSPAVICERCE